MKLTVIFRNDSPMIHCGDTPSYRSVQIELTPEQCEAIKLREHEEISRAFIEHDIVPSANEAKKGGAG
jgi:hypothetical protein